MKKVRGSITIFLTMISVILISLSLLMVDIVRVIESSNFMADAISLSVMAADNCYNKEIFDDLDILVYTMSDEELMDLIIDTLNYNSEDDYFVGLKMFSGISIDNKKLADGWMYSIADVLNDYRNRMGITFNNEDRYYCPITDSYDDEIDTYIFGILYDDTMAEAVAKQTSDKNYYQMVYEYLGDMETVSDDKYSNRFSVNILNWCEGTGKIKEDFKKADFDYSVSEGMKSSYLLGNNAEKRQLGFKWFDTSDITIYGDGTYLMDRYDVANIYSWRHFNTILSGEKGKSGLAAEMEYLLYGNQSDRKNVSKVLSEILKIRMYMNLKALLKAGEIKSEDTIIWALNESWFDTLSIYAGNMIAWEKKITEFNTDKEDILSEVSDKAIMYQGDKDGLNYEDYLKAQFYFSAYSGQICCNETLYANILDMIGYSYNVDIKQAKIGAEVNVEYSVASTVTDRAFTSVGKLIMQNKMFQRTYYMGGV